MEAYERWDPDKGTVSDLLKELGISRQRLYQILDKHGVVPKRRRRQGDPKYDDNLLEMMAENALAFLFNQLHELRDEVQAYREKYGPL